MSTVTRSPRLKSHGKSPRRASKPKKAGAKTPKSRQATNPFAPPPMNLPPLLLEEVIEGYVSRVIELPDPRVAFAKAFNTDFVDGSHPYVRLPAAETLAAKPKWIPLFGERRFMALLMKDGSWTVEHKDFMVKEEAFAEAARLNAGETEGPQWVVIEFRMQSESEMYLDLTEANVTLHATCRVVQ